MTAEDLGLIPDFVRDSLRRIGLPGYKVIRWERDWSHAGPPVRAAIDNIPPCRWRRRARTTSSRWRSGGRWRAPTRSAHGGYPRRRPRARRRGSRGVAIQPVDFQLTAARRRTSAGSNLLLLPMQDACGWRDRINVPATVRRRELVVAHPFTVEQLQDDETTNATARELRALAERSRGSATMAEEERRREATSRFAHPS